MKRYVNKKPHGRSFNASRVVIGKKLPMYYLPIVCSEWEKRQTSGICHITKLEVAEAVTQCYRLLDLRTGYDDALHAISLVERLVDYLCEEIAGSFSVLS